MGLPGSGKTTLANEIAPSINAKVTTQDAKHWAPIILKEII